jgi:hypothetical protein
MREEMANEDRERYGDGPVAMSEPAEMLTLMPDGSIEVEVI